MPIQFVGAHTFGFVWTCDAEAAFNAIAERGFRNVQLLASPPHFDPWASDPGRLRRLRTTLQSTRLQLLAVDLASSDINLASASTDVVDFAVEAYARASERAAELGAPWLCVGSGRRHPLIDSANARLMPTFTRAFERICDIANRRGLSVILENHPQGLLATAPAIAAFLARLGRDDVKVIYDVTNAAASGEDPVVGLTALGTSIGLLHASDAPAGQWRHDPIGSGAIDFRAIASELARMDFSGGVVLEMLSADPAGDLSRGVDKLREAGWALPALSEA